MTAAPEGKLTEDTSAPPATTTLRPGMNAARLADLPRRIWLVPRQPVTAAVGAVGGPWMAPQCPQCGLTQDQR